MSFPSDTDTPQHLTISLAILAEDPSDADLALMSAVSRDTIDALQNDGYTIQPVRLGKRGGDILVEVITTLTTLATTAWSNKESFERILNDTGALVTVCAGIVHVAKTLLHTFKKRTTPTNPTQQPIKITIEIDGAPISIEAADLEQTEAALTLAQQFHTTHPAIAKNVTAQSNVKIKGSVPKVQQRKKR